MTCKPLFLSPLTHRTNFPRKPLAHRVALQLIQASSEQRNFFIFSSTINSTLAFRLNIQISINNFYPSRPELGPLRPVTFRVKNVFAGLNYFLEVTVIYETQSQG